MSLYFCANHDCGKPFESVDDEKLCEDCRGSDKPRCAKCGTEEPHHLAGCPLEQFT